MGFLQGLKHLLGILQIESTASETSYGTGSSVSRASHLGGQRVNPSRGAMGGNPPIPSRGLGFIPNILNSINPNQQPQGNVVPQGNCCDMDQSDTISKIELNPSIILSSKSANSRNDIQLFLQLFDEHRVNGDYH